jgi:hypothetical protein
MQNVVNPNAMVTIPKIGVKLGICTRPRLQSDDVYYYLQSWLVNAMV